MARKTKEEASRTRQQIIDAARTVFHAHGVARSTLEQVARAAGLTRGAVYWHFKDKTELFFAMREDVFSPLTARLDAILQSDSYTDPLDAIEAVLRELFRALADDLVVRQVLEILLLRCEYADQLASVQDEIDRPGIEFRDKVERCYHQAAARGTLRSGLDPAALANDTWAFATGLLHLLLAHRIERQLQAQVVTMIAAHLALRRAP